MLFFYNHKIYFWFEMNEDDEFQTTSLPCCKKSDIKNLFSNIKTFESMDKSVLANQAESVRFLLNEDEFRGFVTDWVNHVNIRKLYPWDGAVFFMEYVNTLKQIANIDANYQFDGRWEGDDGLFDEDKINLLNNIDVSKVGTSPIIIKSECEPELSMKIEDALYAFKNNTTSLYTNEINELIDYNIRRMALTRDLYQNFSATPSIMRPSIVLEPGMKIEDINYEDPNCIFYFYYYSFLPGIRTNLVHLKRVLEEMRK